MIKIERTSVMDFENALRGMRNPMNSWDKSDSVFMPCPDCGRKNRCVLESCPHGAVRIAEGCMKLGENDLDLAQRLTGAGSDHRKFLRQIFVSVDVTAPLYWWKEMETYKVGTVANSTSTMHTIHKKEFTLDDFSWDQLLNTGLDLFTVEYDKGLLSRNIQPLEFLTDYIIPVLNVCQEKYLETNNKDYWYQMIQLLPTSYNQMRTCTLNYENLMNMYFARRYHKLDEWRDFCDWIEGLPYFKEMCLSNTTEWIAPTNGADSPNEWRECGHCGHLIDITFPSPLPKHCAECGAKMKNGGARP